jgi:hypothetical protein
MNVNTNSNLSIFSFDVCIKIIESLDKEENFKSSNLLVISQTSQNFRKAADEFWAINAKKHYPALSLITNNPRKELIQKIKQACQILIKTKHFNIFADAYKKMNLFDFFDAALQHLNVNCNDNSEHMFIELVQLKNNDIIDCFYSRFPVKDITGVYTKQLIDSNIDFINNPFLPDFYKSSSPFLINYLKDQIKEGSLERIQYLLEKNVVPNSQMMIDLIKRDNLDSEDKLEVIKIIHTRLENDLQYIRNFNKILAVAATCAVTNLNYLNKIIEMNNCKIVINTNIIAKELKILSGYKKLNDTERNYLDKYSDEIIAYIVQKNKEQLETTQKIDLIEIEDEVVVISDDDEIIEHSKKRKMNNNQNTSRKKRGYTKYNYSFNDDQSHLKFTNLTYFK